MGGPASACGGCYTRPLVRLLTVLAGLLALVPVLAQTLFGPKACTQTTAAPQAFGATFFLPASVPPPYSLHLTNGKPDDSARVLAGSLFLNGAEGIAPRALGGDVLLLDKPVSMKGTNLLTLTLSGRVGGTLTVRIEARTPVLPGTMVSTLSLLAGRAWRMVKRRLRILFSLRGRGSHPSIFPSFAEARESSLCGARRDLCAHQRAPFRPADAALPPRRVSGPSRRAIRALWEAAPGAGAWRLGAALDQGRLYEGAIDTGGAPPVEGEHCGSSRLGTGGRGRPGPPAGGTAPQPIPGGLAAGTARTRSAREGLAASGPGG